MDTPRVVKIPSYGLREIPIPIYLFVRPSRFPSIHTVHVQMRFPEPSEFVG